MVICVPKTLHLGLLLGKRCQVMIPNQWGLNENGEMNLFCLLWYRWKKLYGPFLLMGFKGLKAAEPLQGDDLLFIIKSSGVPGTNLINLRWMKSWVSFGANQWFWTWDLCALKGGWTIWMGIGLWMMRDNEAGGGGYSMFFEIKGG